MTAVKGLSPLAHLVDHLNKLTDRTEPVFGVVVHQTGSGIVDEAIKKKKDPLEYAVAYYQKPDSYSPHYVVGYDGTIIQIADEHGKAQHVGFASEDRAAYLDGTWEAKLPVDLVKLWHEKWTKKSPAHLFPGPSVNNVYVGIEMIPIVNGNAPVWFGKGRYTLKQHQAIVDLSRDISERWSFPSGWQRSGRLVGHEDVNPIQRHVKSGGWDPGALRREPWFDFEWVRKRIEEKTLVG